MTLHTTVLVLAKIFNFYHLTTLLCETEIKISLTGGRNTEVEKAEERGGLQSPPTLRKTLLFLLAIYKYLKPRCCECLLADTGLAVRHR